MTLDLTLESSQTILLKLLEEERIFSIWAAPPCGTASRAREKANKGGSKGKRHPPPLRSDAFPEGIPAALAGQPPVLPLDATRLQQANIIYDFVASFFQLAHEKKNIGG